jgi:DNA-binding transcriptional ArsR family regulator
VLNLGLPKGFSRVAIALFRPGSQMANTLSNSIALCVLAAHLILELLARLRDVGLADELSYLLPLTQELIADVLSLSGPHVSRMLRSLREEGLVTIEGHRLTVKDLESLTLLAGFDGDYLARSRIPGLR